MGQHLQEQLPSFHVKGKLLGCIVHVINLGAKAGLAILGGIDQDDEAYQEILMNLEDPGNPEEAARAMMCI